MSAAGPIARGEGRRKPRVRVCAEAAYEDLRRQVFLRTHDISESGVFLHTPEPPEIGATARILLELPGEPALLRGSGVVVRHGARPCEGFALAFDLLRLPAASRRALRRFIARAR